MEAAGVNLRFQGREESDPNSGEVVQLPLATEATTWGLVKALYAGQ
jgi:hypothetical protein